MGFAAVARVTEERWIACSVLDTIQFGLKPGGELVIESTICHEIRQSRQPVVIDHVAEDAVYCRHHTPLQYGFQSYISMPIFLPGGRFFGTLCSIDPQPAKVNTPEMIGMFRLFAELIAFHIDAQEKLAASESTLLAEREVSELREQFIGVLGHDLRTPLAAISMGAALLRRGNVNEDQDEVIQMIERSSDRISGLIDDTLDFARGRLGGGIILEINEAQSVEPLLQEVIHEARVIWPEREILTDFALVEAFVFDRKRLAQLFTNLLTNAMNHGRSEAPVKIEAASGGGVFEFSVSNAAAPIPPVTLARLFEPFSRGGPGDYGKGLGLGLYIAAQIAKSHGGTLSVISNDEETRFTFVMRYQ